VDDGSSDQVEADIVTNRDGVVVASHPAHPNRRRAANRLVADDAVLVQLVPAQEATPARPDELGVTAAETATHNASQ
jgi:glycerophosphoryl diester phosphodiesterase